MSKTRIAVVGCGYWGLNLIRNFSALPEVEVKAACDFDLTALARVKRRYPAIDLQPKFEDILADSHIDAVVIATPVSTHFSFARLALLAGKHVLVEKPMATSSAQALELIELAGRKDRTLMVDQTFVYGGAVQYIRSLIEEKNLGEMLYFDFARAGVGLVQSDINVLWDLGPHDFSIFNYLCDRDPLSVSATGVKHLGSVFENLVYVSARFDSNLQAHFQFNWLAPMKVRRAVVGGSKKTVVYDDLETNEKVKIYNQGIRRDHEVADREQLLSGYRDGDMFAPNLDTAEALRVMAADFVGAIVHKRTPVSNGNAGYRVVRLLEAAQNSMAQNGQPVEVGRSALKPGAFTSERPAAQPLTT